METVSDRASVYLGRTLQKRLYDARRRGAQISVSALTRAALTQQLDEFEASKSKVSRSRR